MPRGVNNWTFNDVATLLKENGFFLNHVKGSHFFYVGFVDNKTRQVCVPKHGNIAIKPRTLKGIIEQSGLTKNHWSL